MDEPTENLVHIHCEIAAKLNFACHQSAYPVLRNLRIENSDKESRLENLLITIAADPPFLKPKSWQVDRIAPTSTLTIKDRDLVLDGGFLLGLSDSVRGTLSIRVERSGELLAEVLRPVELLAYNEWGGAGYMPELLAAFSMPNDPAVDRVLHAASLILRKAGKADGIDGYKSGSRQRVWEIASAIYTAIANLGISYALPPVSFERDGQKIRLPSQIMEGGVATCLDSTMLFASALEQAGLNPVVALPEGHALIGVWLQPEDLSTIVIEDAETLRKRYQLKELVMIESTFVTTSPSPPFSSAVSSAMDVLSVEHDATFSAAVDIKRARAHRISPLGIKKGENEEKGSLLGGGSVELQMEEAPVLPDFDSEIEEETPDTPAGRLERWQRKLLDLSARNPLLNHKTSSTSLKIICPDPASLEDKLAEGAKISIQAVPQPSSEGQDSELHRQRTGEIITDEYARAALDKNQILVDLSPELLSKRIVEIYRKTQTALQEGGANTLYLALGFLHWKRDEKDDRRFRAPLVLLPVTLQRQSVRSGVKMLAHDDEPRFNTTLLEMLRKDFEIDIKGLDGSLPEDESGVDVLGVWNRVRKAVKDAPGFEVVEEVVLGHFSFAKFLMWKDLVDRADALRTNTVVRHLIDSPRDSYPSKIGFVERDQLDRDFKPSDLLTPLPADSAQMAAVASADLGKDFIIIGPPGTGKSQTIGNLIAHLLGKGKTVLFVSEKTAALNVVYRRLDDVGLGRFCLELHSNKASKADILKQLSYSWDAGSSKIGDDWNNEANRLLQLRDRLNRLVDHLHRKYRNGLTPHYAIGVKIRDEGKTTQVEFSWPSAEQHDEDQLNKMRDAVGMLEIQAKAVAGIFESPFQVVTATNWSPQWEGDLVARALLLSRAAETAERACESFCETVDIVMPDMTMTRLESLAQLARILTESYRKQTAYALDVDGAERVEALEEAITRLKAYANAQSQLSCSYDPMAWRKLDGEDIARRWADALAVWWPKSIFARRSVINLMRQGGARGKPDPTLDAEILTKLRVEGEAIDRLDRQLSTLKDWTAHSTDPKTAQALRDLGGRARVAVSQLADDVQSLANVRGRIRALLQEGNDLLAPDAPVGRAANDYLKAIEKFSIVSDAFEEQSGRDVRELFSSHDRSLKLIRETADELVERRLELNAWCAWRKRRTEAMDLDLMPLVDGIERGYVSVNEITDTFETSYCTWWSARVIGEDEVLRSFSTVEHMDTIEKFRAVDTEFQKVTSQYIAAKLSGELPLQDGSLKNSQWGVVRHEINKKKRHKPVRLLMEEAPDVITKLTPCLMMSPLSVAQYLPAGKTLFDVVIFDEASQITVWDAVGSIARGKQVIVAGDPKQMPPTNFFNRADDDPDGDIENEGDLESILDELRSANIPEQTLNLHYRSRRESLIAFSNSRYYDNLLVTFPAPIHPDQGVRLVRPDGFYARGKARHNQGEAHAIVKEIVRRLTSKDSAERDLSIGVVTFNTEQQSLILDLLDKARGMNPGIEWAFADDKQEPVFVKNLETVQGDERDVILFSVTYGPDQSGHMTMNFGPLNRDGGERRLNVAMTRARSEMVVFSVLHPDKIDLSRTSAQAVTDLKHFLEYAERGPSALGASVHGSLGDFESPFETAVARALRDKGWVLHPQIGVSAFRIDMGIVHPDQPGVYLAGIECDGAMYHSSANARERDKIRQAVLEGLGWTLFRVWSTDWWINKAGALEKLDRKLRAHLEADRTRREKFSTENDYKNNSANTTSDDPKECLSGGEDEKYHVQSGGTDLHDVLPSHQLAASQVVPLSQHKVDATNGMQPEKQVTLPLNSTVGDTNNHCYVKSSLTEAGLIADPGQFYEESYIPQLRAMIDHVIDTEGPIHEDVLIRIIARHHGFQRAGRQIRELLLNIAKSRRGRTEENVGVFYWPKTTVKERIAPARYLDRDEELRQPEYISSDELRAINESLSLSGDVHALARAIGISRLSQKNRERLESILN